MGPFESAEPAGELIIVPVIYVDPVAIGVFSNSLLIVAWIVTALGGKGKEAAHPGHAPLEDCAEADMVAGRRHTASNPRTLG
jgi:hypothetical protein